MAVPRPTTLVVRMCSIATRRQPAARLTGGPSGDRTWAASATQTQQELAQRASAAVRPSAPGSVHCASAAGQRRLLETLPQTRRRPRGRGGGGASALGERRLLPPGPLRILQRPLSVEASPTLTEGRPLLISGQRTRKAGIWACAKRIWWVSARQDAADVQQSTRIYSQEMIRYVV